MAGAGAHSFGRDHRLLRPEQFDAVFKHRRSLASANFRLSYRPNGMTNARLGFVIGRKQARLAVVRNRIRRIAREAFRQMPPSNVSCDLVLRLVAPMARADRRVLRGELDALLRKLPA